MWAFLIAPLIFAQATVMEDPRAGDQLMGKHVFNLQWIGTPPGVATVTEPTKGELRLEAAQENKKGDFATVSGRITKVTSKTFELEGTVKTKVSYVNGGQECVKNGHFTFRITGTRKYWRLKEMGNCEGNNVVDYLDVFFERTAPR
jgi:hypothetical protein